MNNKSTLQQKKLAALRLRGKGWTLAMIGQKYGVSRQRVYQWIGRTKRLEVNFERSIKEPTN